MVWGAILYLGRSNLLRIEDNLNSYRQVHEVLQPHQSFPHFKVYPHLSFSRVMHAHMLQNLFEISVQPNTSNFFLRQLIRRMSHLLSTCGIWLVVVSLVIRVLQLNKTNSYCANKQ
ncbi:UNVERIFIED_CONTAM: hypothetical protein NCL1_29473 [Trichonephila clavipes]